MAEISKFFSETAGQILLWYCRNVHQMVCTSFEFFMLMEKPIWLPPYFLTLDPIGKWIKSFSLETTKVIKCKMCLICHWMVHVPCLFYFDKKKRLLPLVFNNGPDGKLNTSFFLETEWVNMIEPKLYMNGHWVRPVYK